MNIPVLPMFPWQLPTPFECWDCHEKSLWTIRCRLVGWYFVLCHKCGEWAWIQHPDMLTWESEDSNHDD